MDRILDAHYAPPHRTATLQKEKSELLKKNKETQEPRNVKTPDAKHAKPLEKNKVDSEGKGKGGDRGRERRSTGHS